MLFDAMKLMSTYNFGLPARRCVLFELFNKVEFTRENIKVFDLPPDHIDERALETYDPRKKN